MINKKQKTSEYNPDFSLNINESEHTQVPILKLFTTYSSHYFNAYKMLKRSSAVYISEQNTSFPPK